LWRQCPRGGEERKEGGRGGKKKEELRDPKREIFALGRGKKRERGEGVCKPTIFKKAEPFTRHAFAIVSTLYNFSFRKGERKKEERRGEGGRGLVGLPFS